MSDVLSLIIAKYNYWLYVILMMIGLYGMIAKNNLIKKVVGMNIFQTAIILFYVTRPMQASRLLQAPIPPTGLWSGRPIILTR